MKNFFYYMMWWVMTFIVCTILWLSGRGNAMHSQEYQAGAYYLRAISFCEQESKKQCVLKAVVKEEVK